MPILKAVRAKCLDCSGSMVAEVAGCLVKNCALYPFRMGKNPWRPPVSEAQFLTMQPVTSATMPPEQSRHLARTAFSTGMGQWPCRSASS